MDKRTLLAVVLSVVVLMVYQNFFAKPPVKTAPAPTQQAASVSSQTTAQQAPTADAGEVSAPAAFNAVSIASPRRSSVAPRIRQSSRGPATSGVRAAWCPFGSAVVVIARMAVDAGPLRAVARRSGVYSVATRAAAVASLDVARSVIAEHAAREVVAKREFDGRVVILAAAAKLLKPGGLMMYATCSLLDEENAEVVESFLAAHAQFELRPAGAALAQQRIGLDTGEYLRLAPHLHGTDGFFAALLAKA